VRNAQQAHTRQIRILSVANALLGAWVGITPSVFDLAPGAFSRNSVVCAVLVVSFSATRFFWRHTQAVDYATSVTGAWVAMSPWIFNSLTTGVRTWNYVLVGATIILLCILNPVVPTNVNSSQR